MPQKRIFGFTPGSPIDGMRLRIYRNMALAGTVVLNYNATEAIIDVVANSMYYLTLHSFFENQESSDYLIGAFSTGGGMMMSAGEPELEQAMMAGPVPPPTGSLQVEDYP